MKQENTISAGEKIELLIDRKGNPERFFSKVESIVTEDTFIITRPIGDEQLMFLSLGEIIRIVFFRDDGAYYFDAQVIERIKHQESISARVVALSEKYKLQRRNYYRLSTMVPVAITYFDKESKIIKSLDTIDISGGGMRIASTIRFGKDLEMDIEIKIPGMEDYIIKGKVVRSEWSDKGEGILETGIEFLNVTPLVRQMIIEYIFTKQRELLKKGYK